MNNAQRQLNNTVGAENNDAQKSKNTPVGVLAIPNESTSILDLNLSWLAIADELRTASVSFDNNKLRVIKEILV